MCLANEINKNNKSIPHNTQFTLAYIVIVKFIICNEAFACYELFTC